MKTLQNSQMESLAELERIVAQMGRPKVVLFVDDNEAFREATKYLLEAGGLTVITASEATEAAHLFEQNKPDLVITDLNMDGIDGIEFIRGIRSHHPVYPPIMLLTAYPNDDRLCKLKDIPGTRAFVVHKPVNTETLEQYVHLLTRNR